MAYSLSIMRQRNALNHVEKFIVGKSAKCCLATICANLSSGRFCIIKCNFYLINKICLKTDLRLYCYMARLHFAPDEAILLCTVRA